jgi:mannitol-specific phosphotransferase system IIBC component
VLEIARILLEHHRKWEEETLLSSKEKELEKGKEKAKEKGKEKELEKDKEEEKDKDKDKEKEKEKEQPKLWFACNRSTGHSPLMKAVENFPPT